MPPGVALRGHRNGHDEILLKDGGEWPQGRKSRVPFSRSWGRVTRIGPFDDLYVNKVTQGAS